MLYHPPIYGGVPFKPGLAHQFPLRLASYPFGHPVKSTFIFSTLSINQFRRAIKGQSESPVIMTLLLHDFLDPFASSSASSSASASSSSSSILDLDLSISDADLEAIVAVQIADLEEALSLNARKGKAREGAPASAAEQALQHYRNYLTNVSAILADARLAASLDQALNVDARILSEALEEEQQALRDREMAIALSREEDEEDEEEPVPVMTATQGSEHVSLPILGYRPPTHTPGANPRLPMGYATSSGTARNSSMTSLVTERECCSCMEFRYCVTAPCGDGYCHICLKQVFKNACTDEELFPPRCCKEEIPLFLVAPFLQSQEIALFKEKNQEFSTPHRTYCHGPQCGAFIPPADIEEDCALCGKCTLMTCVSCKQQWHGNSDCPTDKDLDVTLQIAATEGWQRCRSCHALVERLFGCQHISCRCGYQFCYHCGEKWKTCPCTDWNEHALDRRAEQLAIRDLGVHVVPTRLARRTAELRKELERRHECAHEGGWARKNTPREKCEMCNDTLAEYIWVCNGCKLYACTRCRKNRI
ncbi:hypothetical protein FN846DRAFT_943327 [Sphaerosporella brunnea]|uniref:RBR-type E3 ubiquitin transferase n=1 Tax=Sphaerosporella brunnea TaxID=1250544 RepID=A0A5J5F097_9PEZI|nr:hypothetical protein FN846DRAFT_943327 [Sphaerosporella brunnea]